MVAHSKIEAKRKIGDLGTNAAGAALHLETAKPSMSTSAVLPIGTSVATAAHEGLPKCIQSSLDGMVIRLLEPGARCQDHIVSSLINQVRRFRTCFRVLA